MDILLVITQELLYRPFDREVPQIRVVLPYTNKEYRNIRGVDKAHESADHVPYRITLGDDKTIQGTARSKGGVEVPCLGNRISAHKRLEESVHVR